MKYILICIAMVAISIQGFSFCGFYVAKADASLFNKKSQVILVRDGNNTVVTMSNDFQGDVKDFAMVVPVPVVLKKNQIKVVERDLFKKLDAYSAPRMAEYFDHNPCSQIYQMDGNVSMLESVQLIGAKSTGLFNKNARKYKVKIEAQYSVNEYDIIILSAKDSDGLQRWLVDHDYRIPESAHEVLEPYIKNNLKFFVVKVNLNKLPKSADGYLRPLQISYQSNKFMLPIRLGMANANGEQDMVVYAFTRSGRVECTNYRTIKLPTDRNIPKFIKDKNKFGEFYVDLFDKAYKQEGRNAVFLEYAWNVSPSFGVKCDPCVAPAPVFQEFANAGVDWATDMSASSNVFFTRLHVRYSRDKFPQDLQFQVTPNRENYQCRYVIHNPAKGAFSCESGQNYLKDLEMRRMNEVDELAVLAGWKNPRYANYIYEYSNLIEDENKGEISPLFPVNPKDKFPLTLLLGTMICVAGVGWRLRSSSFKPSPFNS